MALNLIIGKPGSGKSYFAVSKIADYLVDFAKYEKEHSEPFSRKIYTNLRLNIGELNAYVSRAVGSSCDVSGYIIFLSQDFFFETSGNTVTPRQWWDSFDEGALIVIDEVHEYVPAQGAGGKDYIALFTVYISQHRHRAQDLFFITQHTDTIHKNILCMAEGAYHIQNVKSRVIPWLGIPFSDIDVVKEAFGIKYQVANIIFGNYLGRSFKKESTSSIVLRPEIYALYNSHMRGGASSDRPSLQMGPVRAVFWILRRHLVQLTFKASIVVAVFFIARSAFTQLPTLIADSLAPKSKDSTSIKSGDSDVAGTRSDSSAVVPPVPPPEKFSDSVIYVYGSDYIITDSGRVNIGEEFNRNGKKCRLVGVDLVYRSVTCEPAGGMSAVSE